MIVRVYSKKPNCFVENKDIDFAKSFIWLGYFFMTMNYMQMLHTSGRVFEAFENFQLKTYGMKARTGSFNS